VRTRWIQRIALVIAAGLGATFAGVLAFAPAADATQPSGVTALLTSYVAGDPAEYLVDFTTSISGALTAGSSTITLSDPRGQTVFPLTAADYTVAGVAVIATPTGTAGNVTIVTPVSVLASTTVSVQAGVGTTVTNPTVAGLYNIDVSTSADTTSSSTSNYAVTPGPASATTSTIAATPTSIVANGVSTSAVTVQAEDGHGNNLSAGGATVTLSTTLGSIGTVTDDANGTYSATLTSSTAAGIATITGHINGVAITTTSPAVTLTPGQASVTTSTISATPTSIVANGVSASAITVQAKDANGNNLIAGGTTVTLSTTLGSIGGITDNANGTYSATLTSSTTSGIATITGHINGNAITTTSPTVTFTGSGSPGPTPPATPAGATSSANGASSSPTGTATAANAGTTASASGVGALTVAQYGSDPVTAASFMSSGAYFDVALSSGNSFAAITISDCSLNGGNGLEWFNQPAGGGAGTWKAVTPTPTFTTGPPACLTVTLNSTSSPTLSQITGTVFGVSSESTPTPTPTPTPVTSPAGGYWLVGADGGVFSFGNAGFYGSEGGTHLGGPIVGIASSSNGGGYWLVGADGGVFSFGNAAFYGSEGGVRLTAPIVGIASTPDGRGYWLIGADGGVFTFGDAAFYGSEGGTHLGGPIVGIASTPDGGGYWLVGSDGGVFSFGDAAFYGSEGGTHLGGPIVGIASTSNGGGYWLVGADGGVFSFGNATFYGSDGGVQLGGPIVGIG
jgi:hypothetical protein